MCWLWDWAIAFTCGMPVVARSVFFFLVFVFVFMFNCVLFLFAQYHELVTF